MVVEESAIKSWDRQHLLSAFSRAPLEQIAISWVLMRQGRSLYRRIAGVEPNDLQVTRSQSVEGLWRSLPSSLGLVEKKDYSQKSSELNEY